MMRVVCECGRVFQAEDRHAGKRTRCPACGTGLSIGRTPFSGSTELDIGEVPSWWYPDDADVAAGGMPSDEGYPELIRTTILEHGRSASTTAPGRVEPADDRSRSPAARPADVARSLWTFTGAVAVTVAVGLVAISWIWWTSPMAGKASAVAGIRAVGRPAGPSDRRNGPAPAETPVVGRAMADGRPSRASRRLHLLVPAYFYPSGDGLIQWRRICEAAAKVDVVAIVNPASGPGVERNPDYAAATTDAADRGVRLVGYVNTEWAERLPSEVKADVDAWLRFYPRITGFFLDQQATDARHVSYMAEVGKYIRSKLRDALVITNPAVPCDEAYLARQASDVVCVFSNPDGYPTFELPANLKSFDPSQFAAMPYQVPDVKIMRNLVKESVLKRIGWIYITDGKAPNPWSRLPTYWDAEVECIRRYQ